MHCNKIINGEILFYLMSNNSAAVGDSGADQPHALIFLSDSHIKDMESLSHHLFLCATSLNVSISFPVLKVHAHVAFHAKNIRL